MKDKIKENTMFIFIIIAILAIAGIIYLNKKKDDSTGKSAPVLDIKPVTNTVTPSMANPTADPAKEVVTPSMANPTADPAKEVVAPSMANPTPAKKTTSRRRKKKTV